MAAAMHHVPGKNRMGVRVMKFEKWLIGLLVFSVPLLGCDKNDSLTPLSIVQPAPTAGAQMIEGVIEGISASAIVISGQQVIVDPGATIRSGSMPLTFSDLRVGARSRVTAQSDDGVMHASLVDVLDDVGLPVQFQGVIASMTGDKGAFQFNIGRQLVRGNDATEIVDETGARSSNPLSDGMSVDLDALQRAEYAYGKRITLRRPNTPAPAPMPAPTPAPTPAPSPAPPPATPTPSPAPTPAPGNDTTIGGILGPVSGVCPVVAFPVSGRVVVTNSSTTYVGGSCSSLVAGGSTEVSGTPNGNTVVARQVTLR